LENLTSSLLKISGIDSSELLKLKTKNKTEKIKKENPSKRLLTLDNFAHLMHEKKNQSKANN
jgi:hypothetical protein